MDVIDEAYRNEQNHLNYTLAAYQAKVANYNSGEHLSDSNRICEDCGKKIHPKRILAIPSCTRCTNCQTIYEEETY